MQYKWLGGLAGLFLGGPLGALLGYIVGRQIDSGREVIEQQQTQQGNPRSTFLFSLLVFASYIIRADKRIMHSEMQHVRQFLRLNFGEEAVAEGEQILHRLFEEQKREDERGGTHFRDTLIACGEQLQQLFSFEQRLQLLSFLVDIAHADGHLDPLEVEALYFSAQVLGLRQADVDTMLHLTDNSLEGAYKVLQIPSTATDAEVKAAYRRLALENHPDRVAALGEDVRRAAEKKFCEINNAKDRIYKARGL